MPKTLLVVDDSATMRKVLEITFAGDDFRVVTADGASSALARMNEDPAGAIVDTSLGGDDGYALAKEMRSRSGKLAVVVMASRYNPYDPNRGRDAGVDDFVDKPFDTQMLIDKVKKAIAAREVARPAAPPPAPAAPPAAPHVPPAFSTTASFGSPSRPAAVPQSAPAPAPKPPAWGGAPRTHTLSFEGALPIVPAPIISPAAVTPPRHVPAAPPAQPPAPVAAPPQAAPARARDESAAAAQAAPAVNGQFGKKLGELGLSAAQADAVLSLSRELVERVVWEVVPTMAEALIKEEIARLTKEG